MRAKHWVSSGEGDGRVAPSPFGEAGAADGFVSKRALPTMNGSSTCYIWEAFKLSSPSQVSWTTYSGLR